MDYQEPFSTRIHESSINYLMINYLIARDIRERPHFGVPRNYEGDTFLS